MSFEHGIDFDFSNFYLCMLPASVKSEPENNDNKI